MNDPLNAEVSKILQALQNIGTRLAELEAGVRASATFKLPVSNSDFPFLTPGPIIGWDFWEKINFKDGRSPEARGYTDDPDFQNGPRKARCSAHDQLYDECVRQGIPYLHKVGECNYAADWSNIKSYEFTGPTPIHEPNGAERLSSLNNLLWAAPTGSLEIHKNLLQPQDEIFPPAAPCPDSTTGLAQTGIAQKFAAMGDNVWNWVAVNGRDEEIILYPERDFWSNGRLTGSECVQSVRVKPGKEILIARSFFDGTK